jgi:hypothetical protein
MTNYRLFLLSFLTVSWVFLSGLNKPVDNGMPVVETQKTEVELKSIETENNTRSTLKAKRVSAKNNVISVNASQHTSTKVTAASVTDENNPIKRNEFDKPLDLSIQFEDPENANLKTELKSAKQNRVANLFDAQTKKKPQPLELNGGFLMSPEPEAEKLKSVDGAGIVIKLKP